MITILMECSFTYLQTPIDLGVNVSIYAEIKSDTFSLSFDFISTICVFVVNLSHQFYLLDIQLKSINASLWRLMPLQWEAKKQFDSFRNTTFKIQIE